MKRPKVTLEDWGMIDYELAWQRQTQLHQELVKTKQSIGSTLSNLIDSQSNRLIFCEHPHVYTLGKSGSIDHLKLHESELESIQATFYKINRGGDITYHGPGQIVGYFIFDLDCFKPDVHLFVRNIEEGIIRLLLNYGVEGLRIKEFTGVWVKNPAGGFLKICAIGVHLSRWVSMHGFAFNVQPSLEYFDNIIPCGIVDDDKKVTSLFQILGKEMGMEKIKSDLTFIYQDIFQFDMHII